MLFNIRYGNKGLDVQYLLEVTIILVYSFTMLWFANAFIDAGVTIQMQHDIIVSIESQSQTPDNVNSLNSAYALMKTYNDNYFFYYNGIFFLSKLTLSFLLRDIQELIYTKIRFIFVQFFSIENILDIFNAFVVTYWIYKHYIVYSIDVSSTREEFQAWKLNTLMSDDKQFDINFVLATLMGLLFTKLILSLQVSKTFGPMVKILGSMLLDVVIFMLLFAIIFLIFASIGLQIFQDLDKFLNPTQTLITLFSACLGNFDYAIFDIATKVPPMVGYIYMTLFLILTMIMLLNFLVAVLSNTYRILTDVQIGLYLRKVLYLRQRISYDEKYSWIVSAVPPLNILFFPIIPLVLYFKSKAFNNFILIVQYIPVWLIAIIKLYKK